MVGNQLRSMRFPPVGIIHCTFHNPVVFFFRISMEPRSCGMDILLVYSDFLSMEIPPAQNKKNREIVCLSWFFTMFHHVNNDGIYTDKMFRHVYYILLLRERTSRRLVNVSGCERAALLKHFFFRRMDRGAFHGTAGTKFDALFFLVSLPVR